LQIFGGKLRIAAQLGDEQASVRDRNRVARFLRIPHFRSRYCVVSLATPCHLLEHGARKPSKVLVSHMERQKFVSSGSVSEIRRPSADLPGTSALMHGLVFPMRNRAARA
jgi:hypothetical protein